MIDALFHSTFRQRAHANHTAYCIIQGNNNYRNRGQLVHMCMYASGWQRENEGKLLACACVCVCVCVCVCAHLCVCAEGVGDALGGIHQ